MPCPGRSISSLHEDAITPVGFLLIAILFVVMVVAAYLVLAPPFSPSGVPSIRVATERAGNIVYVSHEGGDPVYQDRVRFLLDGTEVAPSAITLLHNQPWPWTPGKTIKITQAGSPTSITILDVRNKEVTTLYTGSLGQAEVPTPSSLPTLGQPPTSLQPTLTPVSPSNLISATGAAEILPVAAFEVMPTLGPAPLDVAFRDLSSGSPTTWQWDFGDKTSSQIRYPYHTYVTAGVYSVSLTVISANGSETVVKSGVVTVLEPSGAEFSWKPLEGSPPFSVVFKDRSDVTPTSWEWDFGDGFTSTQQDPTHTYPGPGEFYVTLTIRDKVQTGAITHTVTIIPGTPPKADLSSDSRSGAQPFKVQFTDRSTGGPTSWQWDFGDGSISTQRNPSHTYAVPGTYTVTLKVSNPFGGDVRIFAGYIRVV
ncbi:MAG: PKD domain-containing protein [Methanomicrobiales archaeon]|nr:PKD domain-containing protein [Methanomicrobiales archaeon]